MIDPWNNSREIEVSQGDVSARLSQLSPAQVYHIRVLAVNHLGTSAPSEPLQVRLSYGQT